MKKKQYYFYCAKCNNSWTWPEGYGSCLDYCDECGSRKLKHMTDGAKFKKYLKTQKAKFLKKRDDEENLTIKNYLNTDIGYFIENMCLSEYEAMPSKKFEETRDRLINKFDKIVRAGFKALKLKK